MEPRPLYSFSWQWSLRRESPNVNATMEVPMRRRPLREMGSLEEKDRGDGIIGLHLIIFLRALMNLRLSSILPMVTLANVG